MREIKWQMREMSTLEQMRETFAHCGAILPTHGIQYSVYKVPCKVHLTEHLLYGRVQHINHDLQPSPRALCILKIVQQVT